MCATLRRVFLTVCALVFLAFGGTAHAQLSVAQQDYYDQWLKTAERAEEVVDVGEASNAALENLRTEIDEYRQLFDEARGRNSARIETLQSQLEALGPPPEDGADEPQDIATLRTHLKEQLNKLTVPRIISEESFNRANGLINEIDRVIRERQTDQLLARGPSPLNPTYWTVAAQDMRRAAVALFNEITTNFNTKVVHKEIQDRAPAILLSVVVGLILIWRGGHWSERAGDYMRNLGGAGSGVWTFVVSLLRIVLPWLGVFLLCVAITLTGVLGVRGQLLLDHVPTWAATFFYFDWIARQLFVIRAEEGLKPLPRRRAGELRLLIDLLAVMLILHELAKVFQQIENISDGSRAVLVFPIILMTALVLLRMQRIGPMSDTASLAEKEEGRGKPGFSKLARYMRRILVLMGLVTPLLAILGYINAAESIIFPAVNTIAILTVIVIVQRFIGSIYGLITGKGAAGRDSLFAVIVGFLLSIAALPIIALFWGARRADLSELWNNIQQGVEIGGARISPTTLITFVIAFLIGYGLTRLLQSGLRNSLLPKTRIDPGGQNAIVSGTGYVGIFLAALIAVTSAGLDLSSLAIVAGALSVGIGFGLQTIVSNFVSGIILLIERPISKGDWIDVNGQMGYVRDISVRSTRIETFDRTDVIVPNSDLISGTVTNYTRGNTVGRVIVPVGVAYGTDTRLVERILGEVANAHPMVLANPAPSIVFQGFGADSLDFEIRAILRDVNWVLAVKSDMNHEINRRFNEEGIEIPFAQRDVWLRNPETLGGVAPPKPEATQSPAGQGSASSTPIQMTEADMDADGDADGDGR